MSTAQEEYYNGQAHQKSGDAVRAIECFERSFALQPHAKTAYRLAWAYAMDNQLELARAWTARAIEMNPSDDQIAVYHAELLFQGGDQDEAERVVRAILQRSPTYGPASVLLRLFGKL